MLIDQKSKGFSIRSIHTDDLQRLLNGNNLDLYKLFDLSRSDLYRGYIQAEFISKYLSLVDRNINQIQGVNRSAKIYCAQIDEKRVGLLVIHFYAWETISNQICYKTIFQNEKLHSLALAKIKDVIHLPFLQIKKVAKIATVWVYPHYRNLGFGRNLFNYGKSKIKENLSLGDYIFLASVSSMSKEKSEKIFSYFLAKEKQRNGFDSISGKIVISGIEISVEEIIKIFGLSELSFDVNPSAIPVKKFAVQNNMHFRGF